MAPRIFSRPFMMNKVIPGIKKFVNGELINISEDMPIPDPLGSIIMDRPAGIALNATNT